MHIDDASTEEILQIINTEDHLVPVAVRREIPYIAQAVEMIVDAFRNGGRLIYVGAGTSGRLGVLDASECPPTYGVSLNLVQGVMARGRDAVFQSKEGAEDVAEDGEKDLRSLKLTPLDVVCGIAASRRTPYVVGAVRYARSIGAKTLYVTTNPRSEFDLDVDIAICPVVGPEVVMGSTRMKSGTAQKLVLNMLTTASMIRMGKVYQNMMVDLQMTNKKLHERSVRVLMMAAEVSYDTAEKALEQASGHVKTALVMLLAGGISLEEARVRLQNANGFIRNAIG